MWQKYVTRRLAVQVAQAWNFGWGEAMERVYGLSVRDTLVFRDDKKTEYYVDQKQHEEYVAGLYQSLENKSFLKSFHRDAQVTLEHILQEVQQKLNQNLEQLSRDELLLIFRDFILPRQTQFYIRMWTVFNIGAPLADVVEKRLREHIKDEEKVSKYLLSLASPLVPNDVLNERIDLLKIAREHIHHPEKTDALLAAHTEKYQHIPVYDFDHDPYTIDHFKQELVEIKDPENELRETKTLFANRQADFEQTLREIKPDHDYEELLTFLKENVFLRDYRDMIRQKLNLQLRDLYTEIGNRLGLSVAQVALLTNDEIIDHLAANRQFSAELMVQREQAFVLIQKSDDVEIYSGDEAIQKVRQQLQTEKLENIKEIRGIVGSKGKARGTVKIVYTNKDLGKVEKGDVLVATMTRQDFVPAMRRAVAIVTDEGSVTAHAAIIARELKIPCIVNTKIGTQVLKDGDEVEVDAEKGVVRIIRKKHSQ